MSWRSSRFVCERFRFGPNADCRQSTNGTISKLYVMYFLNFLSHYFPPNGEGKYNENLDINAVLKIAKPAVSWSGDQWSNLLYVESPLPGFETCIL